MNVEEILNWVQDNKAVISIAQGPEAMKTIVENGSMDQLMCVFFGQGNKGYWVEIALNDDCAGWAYCKRLNDAIKEAFDIMCKFAIEIKHLEADTLKLLESDGVSILDTRRFNFLTEQVEYYEVI